MDSVTFKKGCGSKKPVKPKEKQVADARNESIVCFFMAMYWAKKKPANGAYNIGG